MKGTAALLLVRAVVADPADRAAFDRWYEEEHLPEALAAFGAGAAFRGWSRHEPAHHLAVYAFASVEAAESVLGSPTLAGLIAAFDRRWGGRIARTREVVALAQWLDGAAGG